MTTRPGAPPAAARDRGTGPHWLLWVAATTSLAGLLRLYRLNQVPDNAFYDAAVRSMSLSAHNFFYGAFDPSASASIDKPPLDLWLQVFTVKLLGFSSVTLKLPAAVAATLAVALLYDLVRRLAGPVAGLASALALAVLPVSVLTSRSDTMDSLMMALLVLAAWLVVAAAQRGRRFWLIAAAVVLGLDFNVKLFEALVAAPALVVLAWLTHDLIVDARAPDHARTPDHVPVKTRPRRPSPRLASLLIAGGAFVATAAAWMVAVSLTPAQARPYPIGSSDGTVWNAVFVFNGTDRILKAPHPDRFGAQPAVASLIAATPSRAQPHSRVPRPRSPAGPLRLFVRSSVDYAGLVGVELLGALAFGALALIVSRSRAGTGVPPPDPDPDPDRNPDRNREAVIARAGLIALIVWLLTGVLLFSAVGRLHQRYLEAFTPAVAASLGVGLIALMRRVRTGVGASAIIGSLALVMIEAVAATGSGPILDEGRRLAVALALLAVLSILANVVLARRAEASPGGRGSPAAGLASVLAGILVLSAILVVPLTSDVRLIERHNGDQALSAPLRPGLVTRLSRFLRAHQGTAHYEVAVSAPTLVAPVIKRDVRPVLLLTTTEGRPLVGTDELRRRAGAGEVAYVLMRGRCPIPRNRTLPACAASVQWVQAHATDVSAQVAPGENGLLYRLG